MIWNRVTSWSAETEDGLWYAERLTDQGRKWALYKTRGSGKGKKGIFIGLAAAKRAAENAEIIRRISARDAEAMQRLASR